MKIIRTFCNGKNILLQDPQKLGKYLKLVHQTPISYQGVKQSLGYSNIFNSTFSFDQFNHELYPQALKLVKRDVSQMDFQEYSSFLATLNNYLNLTTSEYPQNEQEFQDAINIIIDSATFIQKFIALQHLLVYFDPKISLYSQLTVQLKDQMRDHNPINSEEWAIKLYWGLLDAYDSEKIELLINKNDVEAQKVQLKLTEDAVKDYMFNLESLAISINKFSLPSKLIIFEINRRLTVYEDLDPTDKQMQLLYHIDKECQESIDKNLNQLNNFYLIYYINLVTNYQNQLQLLSWEFILAELSIRDLSTLTVEDTIKVLILLDDVEKDTVKIVDRLIEKLYNNMNLIQERFYATICVLVAQMDNSFKEKFLKRLYPKINFTKQSAADLGLMMGALNEAKLVNSLVFQKFITAIEGKAEELQDQSLEGVLSTLCHFKTPNEAIFKRAEQVELNEESDLDFINTLLLYCSNYEQNHPKVKQIQQIYHKLITKQQDEGIILDFIRSILNINPANKVFIKITPEMKNHIKSFLKDEGSKFGSQLTQIQSMLNQVYHIK